MEYVLSEKTVHKFYDLGVNVFDIDKNLDKMEVAKKAIEKTKEFLKSKQEKANKEIRVEVEELKNFIIAEDYHQDYLDKNPRGYCHINLNDKPNLI